MYGMIPGCIVHHLLDNATLDCLGMYDIFHHLIYDATLDCVGQFDTKPGCIVHHLLEDTILDCLGMYGKMVLGIQISFWNEI